MMVGQHEQFVGVIHLCSATSNIDRCRTVRGKSYTNSVHHDHFGSHRLAFALSYLLFFDLGRAASRSKSRTSFLTASGEGSFFAPKTALNLGFNFGLLFAR